MTLKAGGNVEVKVTCGDKQAIIKSDKYGIELTVQVNAGVSTSIRVDDELLGMIVESIEAFRGES